MNGEPLYFRVKEVTEAPYMRIKKVTKPPYIRILVLQSTRPRFRVVDRSDFSLAEVNASKHQQEAVYFDADGTKAYKPYLTYSKPKNTLKRPICACICHGV